MSDKTIPPTASRRWLEIAADALRVVAALGLLVATGLLFAPAYEGIFALAGASTGEEQGTSGPGQSPQLGEQIQMVLLVEASPQGARLFVDEQETGEVPAIMTLTCNVGAMLRVRLTHPGYRTHDAQLACQQRQRLEVRLPRARRKSTTP